MLSEARITAFIATINARQAKEFYMDTLGLKLISEDAYAIEFEGKGAALRVTVVDNFIPQEFTVLGFKVANIVKEVNSLKEKNLAFERYPTLQQDELDIWTAPSQAKVAWFKDPDGNLISLTQYPS